MRVIKTGQDFPRALYIDISISPISCSIPMSIVHLSQQSITHLLSQVGHKKLFLLDEEGKANEMIPQCVLDFYVVGMKTIFIHIFTGVKSQVNPFGRIIHRYPC